MLSHKGTGPGGFCLCEVPGILRFLETESRWWAPGAAGEATVSQGRGFCLGGR